MEPFAVAGGLVQSNINTSSHTDRILGVSIYQCKDLEYMATGVISSPLSYVVVDSELPPALRSEDMDRRRRKGSSAQSLAV